jgi:hypothetical protein
VLGDRNVDLARVQRLAGTLLVVVRAKAIFGDLRRPPAAQPGAGGLTQPLGER